MSRPTRARPSPIPDPLKRPYPGIRAGGGRVSSILGSPRQLNHEPPAKGRRLRRTQTGTGREAVGWIS